MVVGEKIHINYSHDHYLKSQVNNSNTALSIGGFDQSIKYKLQDIDSNFVIKNNHILSQSRGAGYWIWKPYFILHTLMKMKKNDVLLYTDSGCSFIDNFNKYIDVVLDSEYGITPFALNYPNVYWCKRDCFILMNADSDRYVQGPHSCASFILCRKTDFTISFFNEFLTYGEDERIITDLPNTQNVQNYEQFRAHRNDQSIYSILLIKYNLENKRVRDPSQWGGKPGSGLMGQYLPVAINSHREKH